MKPGVERFMTVCSAFCAFGLLVSVALLIGFVVRRGAASLGMDLFFGDTPWRSAILGYRPVFDGIWPAMVGTVYLVVLSSVTAIVPGTLSGIYLSEYASDAVRRKIGTSVDILAGTPSILMGLFGFTLILFLRKTVLPQARTCLFLSACCIALLILPYIIRTTQTAFQAIPFHVRMVGIACGFTRWQRIRRVLLPVAARSMISGIILAIGRASEDTAVIMLTGVVAQAGVPKSVWDKFQALPFHIFYTAAEYQNMDQLNAGFATALVLLTITGMLFGITMLLHRVVEEPCNRL